MKIAVLCNEVALFWNASVIEWLKSRLPVCLFTGYLSFGSAVKSDVIQSMSADSSDVIVARIMMMLAIIFSYPVVMSVSRLETDLEINDISKFYVISSLYMDIALIWRTYVRKSKSGPNWRVWIPLSRAPGELKGGTLSDFFNLHSIAKLVIFVIGLLQNIKTNGRGNHWMKKIGKKPGNVSYLFSITSLRFVFSCPKVI